MEKRKQKDTKVNRMKYTTPNSQSWAGEVPRKASSPQKCANKSGSFYKPVASPRTSGGGLDPTVPHLKYGIFPKKTLVHREQSRAISPNPLVSQIFDKKNKRILSPNNLRNGRQISNGERSSNVKNNPPKVQAGESSECPMFMFRPLPQKRLQKLTVSTSSHLDIKPRPTLSPQGNRQYTR